MGSESKIRPDVPSPPGGLSRFKWYGPGLLWMVSSVGAGSVLFTPRVASLYGYRLTWIVFVVIFFYWVWIREIGRYIVATGRTLFQGYYILPGPRGWAIWFIFVPQFFAAVLTVSGIASLVGSALMIAFPGNQAFYSTAIILVSIIIVVAGKYKGVAKIASILPVIVQFTKLISSQSEAAISGGIAFCD